MVRAPLRIGVSACLLGQNVRFDGGHKRDRFVDLLGKFAEFVPVCPEVELGLGIPREPIRLTRRGAQIHLVAPTSGRDLTDDMNALAARRSEELAHLALDGFVVKKDSPSCGMERVRVYEDGGDGGMPEHTGRGLFTTALTARCPRLPVEEEGRLCDPVLRDNFLVRLYVQREVERLFSRPFRQGELVALHASLKLLLLAHSPRIYRELGRELGLLVAAEHPSDKSPRSAEYADKVADALRAVPAVGRHVNVLKHMAGYLKRCASPSERAELGALIEDYRRGLSPRAAPLRLLRHYVRRYQISYLEHQIYLNPYPRELAVGGEK